MHEHHNAGTTAAAILAAANVAISLGYLAMPFVFLRHLRLTRPTLVAGGGFFLGCVGTHLGMLWAMEHDPSWWWAGWHVAQAFATWAFILLFGRMLRHARDLLHDRPEVARLAGEAGPPGGAA